MNLKITTLIEDTQSLDSRLYYEHGLSLYIEVDGIKILFDTGKSGDFIKNAKLLEIDLNKLNYVVISHGHYDHSGGFKKLVDELENSYKVIVGENFFNKKYKIVERDTYKYIGNTFNKKYIQQNSIEIKYVEEDIFYITENIMLFSNFKQTNDFEPVNKKFRLKQDENYIVDDFCDEIVLVLKHEKGLFVILGCSHVGVVNILETILERLSMPIYGIVGGTHLIEADEHRLNKTVNYLKQKDIHILGMSHCTGDYAIEKIKNEFRDNFVYNNTGNIIKLIEK